MLKYIVSQPAITLCIESRSSRLPTTTSAPMSRNACARSSSFRTIARTALPCFNSSSVTVRPTAPTRPAAPVTRIGFAMFLPCARVSLPSSTSSRTSGQEDPAHDEDPHDADDGRDEPRIGAVWCPDSTSQPRGAAQQGKHNGCDPRREERVRDQPGPPEAKRRGHDEHRARERSQHEACPYEVVQARCEHVISRAGDGVREGCDHRDEQEEKRSEGGTGGGRRRAPTVLSRIRQGRPERPREPHDIEDSQTVKHGRDQNPHAIAVVEGCQCVGRCADLRLMAVDDVRDYEAEDRLDAGRPPQAFPERGGCVDAGGGSRELKNRLGRYLGFVGRGETIIVTDRGKPVARLVPPEPEPETTSFEDLL